MLQKRDTQKVLFLNNNKLNAALTAGVYGGIYIPTVYEVAEETDPKWWRKCDVVWSKTLNWTSQRDGLSAPDWLVGMGWCLVGLKSNATSGCVRILHSKQSRAGAMTKMAGK